ncbi:TonB-dependent receptor [Neorhizobium sp. NCHU2750]|uniref:TonB-dependent receptor n=1 Tax=Neorhizobium sp. NCHU2750 TaxID=1825976 RepID=UPI000EB65B2A|nr:iron complex outermembrane recepter protein [Neorhizobium sp. NCHU2750]
MVGRVISKQVHGIALLMATTAMLAMVCQPAVGQQMPANGNSANASSFRFDIPSKSLASAIADVGAVSGWRIAYPFKLPAGSRSKPLSGTMTPQEAIGRLLAGTGIRYRVSADRSVVLVDPSQPAASGDSSGTRSATELQPIVLQGDAPLGTPPVAYAGGQVATGARLGILGNRDVMDTPFNVTSYTAKTIQDQQARSVGDVVKNDPSVRTTWADGSYSNQFFIRGFPVGNPDMAINGLYGLAPYQMAGTSWIDRVEVLKGPGALLSGMAPGGSIGGVINLVPKRAPDDPINRVTTSYLSDGQIGTGVDFARRVGDDNAFGIRFNGSYSDGHTAVDGQSNQLGSASLGLDYNGDRVRLSADLVYQKNYSDNPVRPIYANAGVKIPHAPDASADLGQNWYYAHGKDYLASLRAEYDITDNVTAYATFGAHRNELLGLYNFEYIKNSAGDFDARNFYQPTYNRVVTGEIGLNAKFETGPVRHEVTLSASDLYSELGNRSQNFSSYSSNLYDPIRIDKPDLSGLFDTTPKTNAVTLQSFAITDSLFFLDDRLQLIVGGRQQKVRQKAWNVTTGVQTADYDEDAFTPALGIVVKPWESVSLYANYIEGLSQGPVAPTGATNAGEAFAPLRSKQYEIGAKVDLGDVTATASLFQIEQPSGALDASNAYGVDGETRNRGLELNVFGEVVESIRVLGGVAFMDGVQTKTAGGTNDGKKAIGVPDVQLNMGAEWDTPFIDGLTLSGRVIHTSSQYASVDNTQKIPDWTRFDLGARYRYERENGKPITVRASVENVFDRDYWAAASSSFGLARGAPRTFLVSTTFDF